MHTAAWEVAYLAELTLRLPYFRAVKLIILWTLAKILWYNILITNLYSGEINNYNML